MSRTIRSIPLPLTLNGGEVHIWCVTFDQLSFQTKSLTKLLSVEERTRAKRFYFKKDRRRFIIRHAILRLLLGNYLCLDPKRLLFFYGKNGKPMLAGKHGKPTIFFNMSCSVDLALYGFNRDSAIGVDTEFVRDISEMDQVAERFFSKRENRELRALSGGQEKTAFFNCWTRKEAFIKATGDGLSQPLDSFDVSLTPGERARLLEIKGDSKEASKWSLHSLTLAPNYTSAFAVMSHDYKLKVHCYPKRESVMNITD